MVGSNYPPGMSKRDFVRAGIDQPHSHECEFEDDGDGPIFEDGAAIFWEYCMYSEGRWGEGYSCDKEKSIRLELSSITKLRENAPNIEWLAGEADHRNCWSYCEKLFEESLIEIETQEYEYRDIDPENHVEVLVEPPRNIGKVLMRYEK